MTDATSRPPGATRPDPWTVPYGLFRARYPLVENAHGGAARHLFAPTGPEAEWVHARPPVYVWTVVEPFRRRLTLVNGIYDPDARGYLVSTVASPAHAIVRVTLAEDEFVALGGTRQVAHR